MNHSYALYFFNISKLAFFNSTKIETVGLYHNNKIIKKNRHISREMSLNKSYYDVLNDLGFSLLIIGLTSIKFNYENDKKEIKDINNIA